MKGIFWSPFFNLGYNVYVIRNDKIELGLAYLLSSKSGTAKDVDNDAFVFTLMLAFVLCGVVYSPLSCMM